MDQDVVEEWLSRSSTGPFDGDFADYLRSVTHVGGGTTFPGVSVPLPPQMVIGLIAWLEGEILVHLGDVSDTITLSGVGGIWMDQLMLQLGVMLEPVLGSPSGPRDDRGGDNAALHPYADLAGFGVAEVSQFRPTAAVSRFLRDADARAGIRARGRQSCGHAECARAASHDESDARRGGAW